MIRIFFHISLFRHLFRCGSWNILIFIVNPFLIDVPAKNLQIKYSSRQSFFKHDLLIKSLICPELPPHTINLNPLNTRLIHWTYFLLHIKPTLHTPSRLKLDRTTHDLFFNPQWCTPFRHPGGTIPDKLTPKITLSNTQFKTHSTNLHQNLTHKSIESFKHSAESTLNTLTLTFSAKADIAPCWTSSTLPSTTLQLPQHLPSVHQTEQRLPTTSHSISRKEDSSRLVHSIVFSMFIV